MDDKGKRRMRKLEIPNLSRSSLPPSRLCGSRAQRPGGLMPSFFPGSNTRSSCDSCFAFCYSSVQTLIKRKSTKIIVAIAANNQLFPETLIAGIRELGGKPVSDLLDDHCKALSKNIERIKPYRNKLMHGQMTGLGLKSDQLERDVIVMVDWIHSFGEAAKKEYGYNGVDRNAYRHARATETRVVKKYPFNTLEEFEKWLKGLSKKVNKAKANAVSG